MSTGRRGASGTVTSGLVSGPKAWSPHSERPSALERASFEASPRRSQGPGRSVRQHPLFLPLHLRPCEQEAGSGPLDRAGTAAGAAGSAADPSGKCSPTPSYPGSGGAGLIRHRKWRVAGPEGRCWALRFLREHAGRWDSEGDVDQRVVMAWFRAESPSPSRQFAVWTCHLHPSRIVAVPLGRSPCLRCSSGCWKLNSDLERCFRSGFIFPARS